MFNVKHVWVTVSIATAIIAAVVVAGWFSGYLHVVREYHYTVQRGDRPPLSCTVTNDFTHHEATTILHVSGHYTAVEAYTPLPKRQWDASHIRVYWGRYFRQ